MSTQKLTLTADHVTYSCDKLPIEHDNLRLWAIQKQYPTNEAEYQSAQSLALYWYYNAKLGCAYNAAIQRKIGNIDLEMPASPNQC